MSVARVLLATCLLTLTACGFAYEKQLVGRYHLVAVDLPDDIILCWSLDEICAGDGLPGPTVVAAGFDNAYVVAATDPAGKAPSSKSATQFYYIVRSFEDQRADAGVPYEGIHGPLSKADYLAAKVRLHLPEFTWTYENR